MTDVFATEVFVVIVKEGDYFVAYCPPLELSSYGKTEAEARAAFEEAMQIFVEETERKGTLEKVLLNLGWTLRKKPTPEYQPPQLQAVDLAKLMQSKDVRVVNESFEIPLHREASFAEASSH